MPVIKTKEIIIIGAGLTGLLLAILLGSRGYIVKIYERNAAPDEKSTKRGKSINLTLSARGMLVLERAGIGDAVKKISVPTYGRCIHQSNHQTDIQPYGNNQEALYAISRHKLSLLLLITARNTMGVCIEFNKKCIGYDLNTNTVYLVDKQENREEHIFNSLIAADGIHSSIRNQMQREIGFNFSQHYADQANKEMSIPIVNAKENNLISNHIHIWPRHESMILSIPNSDGSFTSTLQLPLETYQEITTETKLIQHFNTLFPDILNLMPNFVDEFFQHPIIPMITVRCSPWHIAGKLLLIGDAAHGIYPSYGQGANAGFEDCRVLDDCLTEFPHDIVTAFIQFQEKRKKNTDTIATLSEKHFEEIRTLVAKPHFLLKKHIERQLNLLFPTHYFSVYSYISFTTITYSKAASLEPIFNQIINQLLTFQEITSDINSLEAKNIMRKTVHDFISILIPLDAV